MNDISKALDGVATIRMHHKVEEESD